MIKRIRQFYHWSVKEQNEWVWEIALTAEVIFFGIFAVFFL